MMRELKIVSSASFQRNALSRAPPPAPTASSALAAPSETAKSTRARKDARVLFVDEN